MKSNTIRNPYSLKKNIFRMHYKMKLKKLLKSEMKVNNASLTGESEELLRVPFPKEPQRNIFEAANVAFFGTACTNGSGTGLVFKTGDNTVIGQIASLA